MRASSLAIISDQIFEIPLNLYRKMLVQYTEIIEDEQEKNINLKEYKYINIQFQISETSFVWTSIGIKQHIPNWADKNREQVVTKNTFAFWTRPQKGAPEGQINIFDDHPLITIETEKVNEYNAERLENELYVIEGKKLEVVLSMHFDSRELIMREKSYYPEMVSWVLRNLREVKKSAEKRGP